MRPFLATIVASLTCTLGLPAAAPAAGWITAAHQPPDGWRTDERTYSPSLAAAPDGRVWAGWDAGGDVLVSRRAPGGAFAAAERIGGGAELPLLHFQALGPHGPAALWNAPGGQAIAEPGPDGAYAEIANPPFADAPEQGVRLARLADGGLLAAWRSGDELRASVRPPGEPFSEPTVLAGPAPQEVIGFAVLAQGDGALVVWSERAPEGGRGLLRARTLGADREWSDAETLDEQLAPGEGTAQFTIHGLAPREGGGWTLLSARHFAVAGEPGVPWRLEVRDGEGTVAQDPLELDSGRYEGELGGGVTEGGLEPDGSGGTLAHWRVSSSSDDRRSTLYRPAGGDWTGTPAVRDAAAAIGFVPTGAGRLHWLEYGLQQGEHVAGGPAVAGVLSDAPPPDARNVRPRTFAGDGAGHAFLAWDGALRVYDEAPPVLSGVQAPATAVAGQAARFAATASDAWSGASVVWDFGDGATATGDRPEHAFARPGRYDVRVSAVDGAGNRVTDSRIVEVAAAPGPKVEPPPIIVEPVDRVAPLVTAAKVRGRRATVEFSLSESGRVDLRLYREREGVRRGGKCRTSRAAKRRGGKACRRLVRVQRVEFQAVAGTVKRRLSRRRLATGRYRVVVRVRDAAGNVAKRRTMKLKISA